MKLGAREDLLFNSTCYEESFSVNRLLNYSYSSPNPIKNSTKTVILNNKETDCLIIS